MQRCLDPRIWHSWRSFMGPSCRLPCPHPRRHGFAFEMITFEPTASVSRTKEEAQVAHFWPVGLGDHDNGQCFVFIFYYWPKEIALRRGGNDPSSDILSNPSPFLVDGKVFSYLNGIGICPIDYCLCF